jgi:prepilin-type N-terminal cleavage/methylation domain-containing protein
LKAKNGFSLIELLVVIIIISILASIGYPLLTGAKERALDKEAIANLKLLQAAERIYRMENGTYYPPASIGRQNDIEQLNINLKLTLPSGSNRNWNYAAKTYVSGNCCLDASRAQTGINRFWKLWVNSTEEPEKSSGVCN